MGVNIKPSITWVGKVDWDLRQFHGYEYSTHRGSTYNSYLVRDEKTVLIDTVWQPFAKEFVANLQKETDLTKIDYIVANHGEIDHSGALSELMRYIPNTPIYCTVQGTKSLKGHYHQDWNFVPVKTGDRLSLGSKELVFIEAPMLHWPDSMFCYLTQDNVLFSNDAFGQHYASEYLFNDLVDPCELFYEAIKYYANILSPFNVFVTRKIQELLSMNLPIDMICPSHGVIWRNNPKQIVEKYLAWAKDYQENQITVVYDTMWNGTRRMAESLAKGMTQADPAVNVKLFNAAKTDKNDIITEIFKSKAFLLGSPTINRGILVSIAGLLEALHGFQFKGKKAGVFGCSGWSKESTSILAKRLKEANFEVLDDGIQALWNPDDESVQRCVEYGLKFAKLMVDSFRAGTQQTHKL